MSRISLYRSSSVHLAAFFTALIALAIFLFAKEIRMVGPGSDAAELGLRFIVMVLLFISGGLFFISYYVTKRINTIIQTTETIIKTGDLSARIPVDNPWDDLSTLSAFINQMLAQIEESVHAIRHVSDNIAHDLRTPLTRLRNHIEQLQAKPCDAETYQAQLRDIIHECDHILATFNALLRITRVEHQRGKERFATVKLHKLLEDIVELYEPLASEKNIALNTKISELTIHGEADLLFQCFSNIVDNAIRYTPAGGHITLNAYQGEHQIILQVEDSGPGIPDAQKDKVFQRFFRVDTMRCTPGSGLGLSLVKAVLKHHQASISLHDNTPTGLIFKIAFPIC